MTKPTPTSMKTLPSAPVIVPVYLTCLGVGPCRWKLIWSASSRVLLRCPRLRTLAAKLNKYVYDPRALDPLPGHLYT